MKHQPCAALAPSTQPRTGGAQLPWVCGSSRGTSCFRAGHFPTEHTPGAELPADTLREPWVPNRTTEPPGFSDPVSQTLQERAGICSASCPAGPEAVGWLPGTPGEPGLATLGGALPPSLPRAP